MSYDKELFYKDFVQRENEFMRAPYNPEMDFYTTIKAGDVKKMAELLAEDKFVDKPGLGSLSEDRVQNMKYHFVITTALAARFCIQGGMDLQTAYGLSDYYINKADKCTKTEEISALHPAMCMDYTKRMKQLRKQSICSRQVVMCIDYIYDNLHKRISLKELADHVKINPAYLSRLFKKETGANVSDYIRLKKLETAENMLKYSEYRPGEIASILAFPSQSYFTELFKKYSGMTPAEYRKQQG